MAGKWAGKLAGKLAWLGFLGWRGLDSEISFADRLGRTDYLGTGGIEPPDCDLAALDAAAYYGSELDLGAAEAALSLAVRAAAIREGTVLRPMFGLLRGRSTVGADSIFARSLSLKNTGKDLCFVAWLEGNIAGDSSWTRQGHA